MPQCPNAEDNPCAPDKTKTYNNQLVRYFYDVPDEKAAALLASERNRDSYDRKRMYDEEDDGTGQQWTIVTFHRLSDWQGEHCDPADCG